MTLSNRIVLTGGPGTGKTAVLQSLQKLGYPCFQEIIREFTRSEIQSHSDKKPTTNPLEFVKDSSVFNQKLLYYRKQQFQATDSTQGTFVFYDRGIPDILAYMAFFGAEARLDSRFQQACERFRYDQVFIFPPWKAIYHQDEERLETFSQAVSIHQQLLKTYTRFGYSCVTMPLESIENRTQFIISTLKTMEL